MTDSLNILLDGKKVNGSKTETILKLANRYGIQIPTLCNDPGSNPIRVVMCAW
jgi:NADH dehydrogenase/NADH:ubiquinone oxidoreductase subunit G